MVSTLDELWKNGIKISHVRMVKTSTNQYTSVVLRLTTPMNMGWPGGPRRCVGAFPFP